MNGVHEKAVRWYAVLNSTLESFLRHVSNAKTSKTKETDERRGKVQLNVARVSTLLVSQECILGHSGMHILTLHIYN